MGLRHRCYSIIAALAIVIVQLAITPASAQSPSPSPSPSGSAQPGPNLLDEHKPVTLLNPNRRVAADNTPIFSDLGDGFDEAYHIVARTSGITDPVVEAYFQPLPSGPLDSEQNDMTLGVMRPISGTTDVFELYWDIPSSLPEGEGKIIARVFEDTINGFEERGVDEVTGVVDHTADPTALDPLAGETVSLAWPDSSGRLGFHRPAGGVWRTVLDVTTSPAVTGVAAFYSTTPLGKAPVYTRCGSSRPADVSQVVCTVSVLEDPSAVTAVAVLAVAKTQEVEVRAGSSDAMAVVPYLQDPSRMTIEFLPQFERVITGTGCNKLDVMVKDELGRPVVGANVDFHAQGPNDQLRVLPENGSVRSVEVAPHAAETIRPGCPSTSPIPVSPEEVVRDVRQGTFNPNATPPVQGDHNLPGQSDIKHVETKNGTGLDPSLFNATPGLTSVALASLTDGITVVTAWIDDESVESSTEERAPDNDELDEGDVFATATAQWMPEAIKLSVDPGGASANIGGCVRYTVRARSGMTAAPSLNVDLHVTGPSDEIAFCDLNDSTPRRAPDGGDHSTGAEGHGAHDAQTPRTIHTEGETDSDGNFVFGLTSGSVGDSTILAWADGEKGLDNDVQGVEPSVTATTNWIEASKDAKVSFLNPSPYGFSGDKVSFADDGDGSFRVVTRVDAPDLVSGVDIQVESTPGKFLSLGIAERVPGTDTYALELSGLPPGLRKLRAAIPGTEKFAERSITIGANVDNPSTVGDDVYEGIRITQPTNTGLLSFIKGTASITGVASKAAEGVDLFYTKTPAKDTPRATFDWISCGYADLNGTLQAPQDFVGKCTLQGSDQPHQVTGIAALTYDCTVAGCDASPPPPPVQPGMPQEPREHGQNESGDALRVFGFDSNPLFVISPEESVQATDDCTVFTVSVRDQTGQPVPDANVDLHLSDADENASFCASEEVAPARAPDSGGHTPTGSDAWTHPDPAGPDAHHVEGETLANGLFNFGVTATAAGDSTLTGWVDWTDDDVFGDGETQRTSLIHWVVIPHDCTIVGTSEDDVLEGTPEADRICGLGGDDSISGLSGDDYIFGGPGNDVLRGGDGRDHLFGGPGDDRLSGDMGMAICRGGAGKDELRYCDR